MGTTKDSVRPASYAVHQSPIISHQSPLSQLLHLFTVNVLPIHHHAGHAHSSRLVHQTTIFVVHVGEENHLEQPALILQRHEHHVAVILRAHVPVGHHPATQRHS